jgi:hypothetical protein
MMIKDKRDIPKRELQAREIIHIAWHRIKIVYKKYMINWYFFHKAKKSGDKALHIFAVILVDLLLLRVFGLV